MYKIEFMAEILAAMFLFTVNCKKKNRPFIRYIIAILYCFSFATIFPIFKELSYTWRYSSLMFFFLFIIASTILPFIFDITWRQVFFFAIVAYTAQHFSYQIYSIASLAFGLQNSLSDSYGSDIFTSTEIVLTILRSLTNIVVYSLSYVTIYVIFISKIIKSDFRFNNYEILLISAFILVIDIIINAIVVYNSKDLGMTLQYMICVYSIANCLMVFFLLYYVLDARKLQSDLDINLLLLREAEERYKQMKENVDLINIKCHDLKHQIRALATKNNLSKETIRDMENTIQIYDSTMHTGNDVLDLILVEKKLSCQRLNINLKCYADCSKLNYISESDLYNLFGNAIDNAMEAVKKIDNIEKKNINVIVKNVNSFISIMVENYYDGTIKFNKENLPITTKKDINYHGYGIKSIRYIVDKYEGVLNIKTNNNIFTVSILFPQNNEEKEID